ncbi:MAG: hypothetical protein NT025_02855 [bacterium]|nr:hypothetical protein [bacterium]
MKLDNLLPRRCVLVLLLIATSSAAAQTLDIQLSALAWGGSCETGGGKVIAGSLFFIRLSNEADLPTHALVPGWPEGYVLEAALDLPSDKPFVATPGLIERFQPTRYLSTINIGCERDVLAHTGTARDLHGMNDKEFVLHVPDDLAGHSVSFRARYEGGGVSLTSSTGSIRIIEPCDRNDTARIVATGIEAAHRAGHYARAVEIADSMLAVGLSDAMGWQWAKIAAQGTGEYDKAIRYLDRLWEDFGVIFTPSSSSDAPRLNRGGSRGDFEREAYEQTRNNLLQRKAEHEQEQQQQQQR